MTATWQSTPPPKDRPIVAIGQVCWNHRHNGAAGTDPFCDIIHWRHDAAAEGGGYWLYDYDGLAVATDIEDRVVIFHWIDQPEASQ